MYEWYEQDRALHPANYDHAGSSLGWDSLQNQINQGQSRVHRTRARNECNRRSTKSKMEIVEPRA